MKTAKRDPELHLKHEVTFSNAYDGFLEKPPKDYGRHGVDMWCVVFGPHGAIHLRVFTNWMLTKTIDPKGKNLVPRYIYSGEESFGPEAADLVIHSLKPLHKGQKPTSIDCQYLNGKCYSDTCAGREKAFDLLVTGGSDALWKFMDEKYVKIFMKPKPKRKSCQTPGQ